LLLSSQPATGLSALAPAQRAGAQRLRALAQSGGPGMSALAPLSGGKQTSGQRAATAAFVQGFGRRPIEMERLAKRPSSESRQGTNPRVKCAEGAAGSVMGIWVRRKVRATIRMRSRAIDDASFGKQRAVLMVEVAVEGGHCRFILPLARRI